MQECPPSTSSRSIRTTAGLLFALFAAAMAMAQTKESVEPTEVAEKIEVPAAATVQSLFEDFLHYARLGRFNIADAYAKALLTHPELDPVAVLEAANRDRKSVETLLIIIKNSTIAESASRVLDLIEAGEEERRQNVDRIRANVELLGGNPQQEYFAIRHLAESGEYAIPMLVETLNDTTKAHLWPRIAVALPKIGKGALNPLVMALRTRDENSRMTIIRALGEIGYHQAVPYLHAIVSDPEASGEAQGAAADAVKRIAEVSGQPAATTAADGFFALANQYYDEADDVQADPRLADANVWYWSYDMQSLSRTAVAQRLFGPIMAMRCCEEALRAENDRAEAIALWLAANIRRESRLGLDVENGDPVQGAVADPTKPEAFPRALYFTQAAGARYAQLVLNRAVENNDSAVALGAITALRGTAGEASLVSSDESARPLIRALHFPDLVVRIRAALTLGAGLPRTAFAEAELVVPVLASALTLTEREQFIVVEPNEANRNRVAGALRNAGREVIAEASLLKALDRARAEFHNVSAILMASDVSEPAPARALGDLRREFTFEKTPVLLLTRHDQMLLAQELAQAFAYVEPIPAAVDEAGLESALARAREKAGSAPVDREKAAALALEAAHVLHEIALDSRTPFDLADAESALIAALSATDEQLQTEAARVLALLPAPTAQRAVAHVALDSTRTDALRIVCFAALARSSRTFGNLLEEQQIAELVRIARDEPDLTMRTAASQALGAVNLITDQASAIIRNYYGG